MRVLVIDDHVIRRPKIAGVGGNIAAEILPSGSGGAVQLQAGGPVTIAKDGKSTEVTPAQARQILTQQIGAFRKAAQGRVNVLTRQANVALTLQRSSSLNSLLTWSWIALALMASVSIGLGWLVAGRALASMRTMNTRARLITAESLHERLGIEGS